VGPAAAAPPASCVKSGNAAEQRRNVAELMDVLARSQR